MKAFDLRSSALPSEGTGLTPSCKSKLPSSGTSNADWPAKDELPALKSRGAKISVSTPCSIVCTFLTPFSLSVSEFHSEPKVQMVERA